MSTALDITGLHLVPRDRMQYAFTAPAVIRENAALNELFEETVLRMQEEAEGITLATNQTLLLSKIARDFCLIMHYDEVGWQTQGTNARKDMSAQLLAAMGEWRNVLKDNKDRMNDKVVSDFVQLALDSLALIPDDATRAAVQQFQQTKFRELGY